MTARERLHQAYQLAFAPASLHAAWNAVDRGEVQDLDQLRQTVDWALALHQRLPDGPAASPRALLRLARLQAVSRSYRLPTMLGRFRERLGGRDPVPDEVPAWMVRDIGVPPLGRRGAPGTTGAIPSEP